MPLLLGAEPAEAVDWLEHGLKLTSTYGLALLIAVLAVGLVVVVCWLAIKHIPRLVDASIVNQNRVAVAVESLSETMGTSLQHLSDVRKSQQIIVSAGDKALEAFSTAGPVAKSKHDIPSDVFDKLEESRKILRAQGFLPG